MKILHVTHHFHPCTGGIEKHVMDLSLELIARGHQSDVLCLNRCQDGGRVTTGNFKGIGIWRVPFVDLKYYKVARGFLDRVKGYDLVHVHGLGYFLDALTSTRMIHKKPLVLSTHGGFFHTKNLDIVKMLHFNIVSRAALKNVDAVAAVSGQDMKRFSKICKNVRLIPNGIDSRNFSSGRKKKDSFIFVGRFAKNKGIERLIETFGQVAAVDKNSRLYLVGDGEMRGEIEKKVKCLGLEKQIVFEGAADELKKISSLKTARFFISASTYEGFGLSLLEAMASGCIPIVNDIEAFREIVTGGSGFLVDFSREDAAETILKIMKTERGLQLAQQKAVRRAREYDWKRVMPRWLELYREVMG